MEFGVYLTVTRVDVFTAPILMAGIDFQHIPEIAAWKYSIEDKEQWHNGDKPIDSIHAVLVKCPYQQAYAGKQS